MKSFEWWIFDGWVMPRVSKGYRWYLFNEDVLLRFTIYKWTVNFWKPWVEGI